MPAKTCTTAVVLIPPQEVWPAIQEVRRLHDRQFRRWMPHVTLVYPFRRREEFDALAAPLTQTCEAIEPFEVELSQVRWFSHGRRGFTLWTAPEPAERLRHLQDALQKVVPDCDDVRRHSGGFTPHLSIGQAGEKGTFYFFCCVWRARR